MKSSSDKAYLKEIQKKLSALLNKSPKKFSDEDYHKLRVEIKKLKAISGFLEFSQKNFSKKKELKPFSKIYTQAGKVRELQLQYAFLEKECDGLKNYLDKLDKQIQKEKKKFASALSKNRNKKISKAVKKIANLQKTDDDDVIHFMNNEKRKIASLIETLPIKTEDAHQLRKILKEDFYNRKRINWPSRSIKEEDDLLTLLGDWHDRVVLESQIEKAILKSKKQPGEVAELERIKRSLGLQKHKFFNEINNKLEKSVFQFLI
ncbi:MAG: CHAD domain-containing protein [Ginsengibacter sp.]